MQKHLVNHLSRNYKIKCFFPLLTLVLGARLSGGGVREGCVTVHRVMPAVPPLLLSDQSLEDIKVSRSPLHMLTLERVLALHSFAWVWWVKCYIHFM